jgi:Ca2+-binding RTX toxin-like protein
MLRKFIRNSIRPSSQTALTRAAESVVMEACEGRWMLAAHASADLAGGVLTVIGTRHKDDIAILVNTGDATKLDVTRNGALVGQFNVADVTAIFVNGRTGNDRISVDPTLTVPATLMGAQGKDTLNGGGGDDLLDGAFGMDALGGGAGDDELLGGRSKDNLDGGDGNDSLSGGRSNDTVSGGLGDDTLDGGVGSDSMLGGDGADMLIGGFGQDSLSGGAGIDQLFGGGGDDDFLGGLDDDASEVKDHTADDDATEDEDEGDGEGEGDGGGEEVIA